MERVARRLTRAVVTWCSVTAALVLLGVLSLPFLGLHVVSVETGSMAPAIPAGSIVLTKVVLAKDAQAGDVATIRNPDEHFVTHRLVSMRPGTGDHMVVETKGDANSTKDPMALDVARVNKVIAIVPGGGAAVRALTSRVATAIISVLAFAGLSAAWREVTAPRARRAMTTATGSERRA